MFKQKYIILIFLTFSYVFSFSQSDINQFDEDGKRHGKWAKYYQGKKELRYEGQFFHGKEIDTFNYYTLYNGKSVLSAIKIFNPDNDYANVTFIASNKKVISEGKMKGKYFVGKWIFYHKNSELVMTEEYYNDSGKLEGERLVYYKNGVVAEKATYKEGNRDGDYQSFSERNKLLQKSVYKADKLDGETIYYDSDGNVRAKGTYKANLKSGVWEYHENGVLIRKVNHDENKVLYKKG